MTIKQLERKRKQIPATTAINKARRAEILALIFAATKGGRK